MKSHVPRKIIILFLLSAMVCLYALLPSAQAQERRPVFGRRHRIEPNLYAPEFYAEKLRLKFTLVDLPGASDAQSRWEMSYQLYFVSEAEFQKALKEEEKKRGNIAPNESRVFAWNPTPADFPVKILLVEGKFNKTNLGTLPDRIYYRDDVFFKSKIADKDRTKGAHLMTAYSAKIFDASLKQPLYTSGLFIAFPFDDAQIAPEKIVPRTTIYTSLKVSPEGGIYPSQLPRGDSDISWP